MVKFSYGIDSQYPAEQAIELIRRADELGFHGCYLADDPRLRDPWLITAAAARETQRIRLGFSVTHVYLREPTLIAQALATLDELSGGRAEAVVSFGDASLLDTYHVDWRGGRGLARLREAITVMRAYLDDGRVDHAGDFFHYTGLETAARPVQAHMPLLIGAMGGPRSFELAGEVADGVHAVGTSAANSEYVVDRVRRGAEMVGRDWRELDTAAVCITAVADDPAPAKTAAKLLIADWLPSYPRSLVERHGLDYDEDAAPVVAAVNAGDIDKAVELMGPHVVDALAVAGTPDECIAKLRSDLFGAGIEHVVLTPSDPSGPERDEAALPVGLPPATEQMRLIAERIVPAFS